MTILQSQYTRLALLMLTAALTLPAAAAEPGFKALFDGKTLQGWKLVDPRGGGFQVENGLIVCVAGGGGKLMTEDEFANFVLRYEYRIEAAGNNGINIRAPFEGRPAYVGMEIQILDDNHEKWAKVRPDQRTGSIYDVLPARTGFTRPPGEWNAGEITANGRRITVKLNGTTVLDADLDTVRDPEILKKHPGLARPSGHLGLLGHSTRTEFRNIRVKALP
jgi:hypothetical protein